MSLGLIMPFWEAIFRMMEFYLGDVLPERERERDCSKPEKNTGVLLVSVASRLLDIC